jgi:hypothetical protein
MVAQTSLNSNHTTRKHPSHRSAEWGEQSHMCWHGMHVLISAFFRIGDVLVGDGEECEHRQPTKTPHRMLKANK